MIAATKGENNMAYEIKVILAAFASILRKAESIEDAYKELESLANVEGVIVRPLKPLNNKQETQKKTP